MYRCTRRAGEYESNDVKFSALCHVLYGTLSTVTQVACVECQAFGTVTDRRLYVDATLVPLALRRDGVNAVLAIVSL